jgi:acyl-CoA dehydrogenase
VSALGDRARAFAAVAAPQVEAQPDETSAAITALRLLAGEGLLELTVPGPDAGPGGVSVQALCEVRAELAWHSAMLDVMFVMQGLGSYALALGGSETQRAELARFGRGELVAAFALTEPEAGSDLAGTRTTATGTNNGWRLDGHKTFISNAPIADRFTLLARTSGEPGESEGLSMFLVEAGSAGLTTEAFEVMAPHPIGELRLDGVELPASALIGEEGQGLELALGTLARFRTSVAAAANGFAARALHEAALHLSTRRQFGRPLAAFQGLRFDLAEMDTRLRAAQLLVAEAAAMVDGGGPARAEVARAKLFATETACWICDRAVQHLGGRGVRRGEVVERLFREVRALRIYEGTSEVQKLILARELLNGYPAEPR